MARKESETMIAEALRKRDEKKLFEILFEEYNGSITAIAYRYRLESAIGPEDVVQEVFLRVKSAGGIKKFTEDKIPKIGGYLAKITHNVCKDFRSKNVKNRKIAEKFMKGQPTEDHIKEEKGHTEKGDIFNFTDKTSAALMQLPEKQRRIFRLSLSGYKQKEIAEKTGESLSNVKYHLGEAKEKLVKFLECPRE